VFSWNLNKPRGVDWDRNALLLKVWLQMGEAPPHKAVPIALITRFTDHDVPGGDVAAGIDVLAELETALAEEALLHVRRLPAEWS
jgi:hypothetical protein